MLRPVTGDNEGMPRISAPTVAEHRAAQRAALLRAGEDLLREEGLAGVTPRAVCERAGLSRSSFYAYFPTKDDLLVAVAIDAFERWDREIEAALAGAGTPHERLRALVDATMRMTADGEHDIAAPLRNADLSPTRYEDVMALHDALMRPLQQVIAEFPVADPMRAAVLAQGVLSSGIGLVQHGVPAEVAADDVYRLLTGGIAPA